MSTAVIKRNDDEQAPAIIPATESAAIFSMVERIISDPNVSLERVNQAFDFYQKVQADSARKAFLQAKSAFKDSAPTIAKDKKNKQYNSQYSSIGSVINPINEALSEHGLDAKWTFDQSDREIRVTCILSHVMGHHESVTLKGPPDTSGNKNPIQQIKSTLTYLKLATFEAVVGVATVEGNMDDDGNAACGGPALVSDEQNEELRNLITETRTDITKFLAYAKAESLSDVAAKDFTKLKATLIAKKNGGKK